MGFNLLKNLLKIFKHFNGLNMAIFKKTDILEKKIIHYCKIFRKDP